MMCSLGDDNEDGGSCMGLYKIPIYCIAACNSHCQLTITDLASLTGVQLFVDFRTIKI